MSDRRNGPPKPRPARDGRRSGRATSGDSAKSTARRPFGGGKAPFAGRALALPLLILPLISLLTLSFQSLSSPALAAGEEAPSFRWPARGEVVNGFRPPRGHYGEGGHAGIDIALPPGSEVRAAAAGMVVFSGHTPLGLCVSIIHAGDLKTTYVSLQSTSVHRGQRVEAGQPVGKSDGSRDTSSTLPHLHFGMFLKGEPVDPLPFLRGTLLDPGKSLFLGPWEDTKSLQAYRSRHGSKGLLDWIGSGLKTVCGAVADAVKGAWSALGKACSAAWRWTCAAARAVGRAVTTFYRKCVEPWLSPLWDGVVKVVRAALSNRLARALLAGLAAAAVICLAAVGIGMLLGLSLAAALGAGLVGGVAAIGYAFHYSLTAGSDFSFMGCFLGSLAVGGAAAGACLMISHLAPLIGTGWVKLGWLGFGKSFLAHGLADLAVYGGFCLLTGKRVNPWGLLASFCLGGFVGGLGKLVIGGLFASGTAQGLAAGILSSGGSVLGGQALVQAGIYAGTLVSGIGSRLSYMFLCGSLGFLVDVFMRGLAGSGPSLLESLLSFGGGFIAGGMSLLAKGQGVAGLLTRGGGGHWLGSSEFARALLSKSVSRGLKEGAGALIRGRRSRSGRKGKSLRWSWEAY